MIRTILFDLDGTLVPYWQDAYLAAYFGSVPKVFVRAGYEPKRTYDAFMASCYAMIENDGSRTNRDAFFSAFREQLGEEVLPLEPLFEDYYRTDFSVVKSAFSEQRDCSAMIRALREKGYRLVVATNPLFPLCAIEARLSWVGLKPSDFDYITTYDNSRFCKPNLAYYRDLLAHLGAEGESCLMIGNNIAEDMIAAQLGCETYLVRDYLENPKNEDPESCRGGSYADLVRMLADLPAVK